MYDVGGSYVDLKVFITIQCLTSKLITKQFFSKSSCLVNILDLKPSLVTSLHQKGVLDVNDFRYIISYP